MMTLGQKFMRHMQQAQSIMKQQRNLVVQGMDNNCCACACGHGGNDVDVETTILSIKDGAPEIVMELRALLLMISMTNL